MGGDRDRPLKIARKLWKNTRLNALAGRTQPLARAASTDMATSEPQPVGADCRQTVQTLFALQTLKLRIGIG